MRKFTLPFLTFAFAINCSAASPSLEKPHNEVIKVMEEAMAESDLPSVVAVAINSKGQRIEYTYGGLSWGKSKPVKTSSLFRIHSMTKLVTSIAAMQLVEQGKLELDQNLSELLPEILEIPIF